MSNPPAGWYPDPTGQPNTIRWWDGKQWTGRTEVEDAHPQDDDEGDTPVTESNAAGQAGDDGGDDSDGEGEDLDESKPAGGQGDQQAGGSAQNGGTGPTLQIVTDQGVGDQVWQLPQTAGQQGWHQQGAGQEGWQQNTGKAWDEGGPQTGDAWVPQVAPQPDGDDDSSQGTDGTDDGWNQPTQQGTQTDRPQGGHDAGQQNAGQQGPPQSGQDQPGQEQGGQTWPQQTGPTQGGWPQGGPETGQHDDEQQTWPQGGQDQPGQEQGGQQWPQQAGPAQAGWPQGEQEAGGQGGWPQGGQDQAGRDAGGPMWPQAGTTQTGWPQGGQQAEQAEQAGWPQAGQDDPDGDQSGPGQDGQGWPQQGNVVQTGWPQAGPAEGGHGEAGHDEGDQQWPQQGGWPQQGDTAQSGWPQAGQDTGQQGGWPQSGQDTGQQGGWPQSGQDTGQQGGWPQAGQDTGQQGGWPQSGQDTGAQTGWPQQGADQGGDQSFGPPLSPAFQRPEKGGKKRGGGGGPKLPLIIAGAAALVMIIAFGGWAIFGRGGDDPGTNPSPTGQTSGGQTTGPTQQPTTPGPTSKPSVPTGQSRNPALHAGNRISSDAISFPRLSVPWSDRKRFAEQIVNSHGQYVLLQPKFDGKNDWYASIFVGALSTAVLYNGDVQATANDLAASLRQAYYSPVGVTAKPAGGGGLKRNGRPGWVVRQTITVNQAKKPTAPVMLLTVGVFDLGDGSAVAYVSDIPVNRADLTRAANYAYSGVKVG